MNVGQLIALLQQHPADAPVLLCTRPTDRARPIEHTVRGVIAREKFMDRAEAEFTGHGPLDVLILEDRGVSTGRNAAFER